jgi:diguanylate cyclase (GGDEF)-like protein
VIADPAGSDLAVLHAELLRATQATQHAYRDSSRLIRLLAVLAEPASPAVLIDRTLGALSEFFSADLVCLTYSDGSTAEVITARGFDENTEPRIPELPGAPGLAATYRLGIWACPENVEPPTAGGVAIRSAAYIPLTPAIDLGEGLLLLRSDQEPFLLTELQLLQSVASRLWASLEEAERREAIERLARTGHRLTRHLEVEPLLDEALRVLCDMTGAEAASAITVHEGTARLRVEMASRPGIRGQWPSDAGRLMGWSQAERGEPWVCADLRDCGPERSQGEPRWVRNVICVPVLDDSGPMALLYAGHSRPGFFSRPTVEAAAVLAGHVGAALVNARLYRALADSESQLRLLTDELRRRATHDSLTGLANRDVARQLLESSLASPGPGMVGLLFCDLDKFKAVNDRLGHEAGDDLLRQVAARLRACMRDEDLLARLGGDEFLIVLPKVADLSVVTRVGRRVLDELAEPFMLGRERVQVSASVGGVVGERGGDSSEAGHLLRDADAAMYAAKNGGRGRVEVFDRLAADQALAQLRLREDLLTALAEGQLEVHYQPIVGLDDRSVIGFEALLRWNHPVLGAISPADFIPMAEETGAITAIGPWVLAEACGQLGQWHRDLGVPLSMAVNVSPIQLQDPRFADECIRVVHAVGLDPQLLWLEVTESIEVTVRLTDQLRQLHASGIRIAMDDFGMSYSNLGYLKRLPVQHLKIDRTFVAGLTPGEEREHDRFGDRTRNRSGGMDRGIVRAILAIAESAGMSVVAEGIETEEQRRILLDLGCRQGQGYLFAEPMAGPAATSLLELRRTSAGSGGSDEVGSGPLHRIEGSLAR